MKKKSVEYLYIAESRRRGQRVRQHMLEYLGRADTVSAARLRRALAYWGVKAKVGQRKRR